MTAWRCAHDARHPVVEADLNPLWCEALVARDMRCGARMEEVTGPQTQQQPTDEPKQTNERKETVSKLIQMSSGAPDIADGNYIVTLTGIEGPKVIVPQSGPQAGEEVRIFDWTFATEDGQEFSDTTSARTGPRSKMRAWISALLGRAPAKDEGFDPEDLVGRQAVAVIRTNDAGWPRIETLGVLMQQPQPVAATQPTPQPPVAPAAQPVAAAPAQAAPPPAAAPAPELPLG